jgi:2-dehydro-3-deoxygalactonokinase
MAELVPSVAVALDGGTTNTRARLIRDGRVVATARRSVGVRDAVFSEGAHPLVRAVRESIAEVCRSAGGVVPDLVVAAGMLTSDVGLEPVPHVGTPAGLAELARGAQLRQRPEVADQPILFIPGVRTAGGPGPDGWVRADVMRGEECETIGALRKLSNGPRPAPHAQQAFLWPGSHTKLVEVDGAGRIVRSQTTMAGEMTEALARHTLLAASLPGPWPEALDSEALLAGAQVVTREGLGRAAFLVRIATLTQAFDERKRAAFWIGAVIADDVAHLARHPILEASCPVWVGGRQPQRSLYAAWLAEQHSGPVTVLDDETCEGASALGALAIADYHRQRCR